jgi:carbamoyltransferase
MLEEAEFHIVRHLQRTTGLKALCMAGGVALNSSFNGKILPDTEFKDIFIQPAANDAGTALGVAYYIYHQILGRPRCFVMNCPYTGPEFDNGTIAEQLSRRSLAFKTYNDHEEIARIAAQLIAEGKVVGWFQGQMEWGPRALGNRSIIADPRRADMKDVLNARIKHREKFRPFAPSVTIESVADYFDQTYPEPFMIKVYNVLEHKRDEIPAVTHVDGTGRLQTVNREANPLYWRLIKEFENLTGVPVVLNTSFNENEPIVCRPEEAIDCFQRTKMDVLAIGNYLICK